MRVLVTGEQGNVARAFAHGVRELNLPIEFINEPSVEISAEMDILHSNFMISVKILKPDVILHAAALVNTDKCQREPERAIDVNLRGTYNVLEACRKYGSKLVYVSTTATYDPTSPRPYKEGSRQRPSTLYGITKYAGELLVTGQSEVPWCVVRPCFIFGLPPYDHSSQLVRVAMHSALLAIHPECAGEKPVVTLNPNHVKDYMWHEDFGTALAKVVHSELYGEVLNVSGQAPRETSMYFDRLSVALKALGVSLHMGWDPDADYMGNHLVDSSRLRAITGWAPASVPMDRIDDVAAKSVAWVEACKQHRVDPTYQ